LDCGKHPLTERLGGAERFFCCLGCLNVYVILSASGVAASGQSLRDTELFRRSLELGLVSQRAEAPPPPAPFPPGAPAEELLLRVSGMWCTSCAWLIEHVLTALPGVVSAEVSFASDTVKVAYQPQYLPAHRIIERISSLGYRAQRHSEENAGAAAERRDLLLRTGLAFFFWLNIMTFSLAIYVSYFQPIADSVRHFLPFVLMALATPVVFYCAQPILRLAGRGLLHGAVRMETLLSLGILTAYFYSSVQAFRGEIHVFFDTASAIVALVLAGKSVERGAKERTTRWLAELHSVLPNKARILVEGQERMVNIQALEPGQIFLVKPGERIPADGLVRKGEAHADESLLTGESQPVAKYPGCAVVAGSVNTDGLLRLEATRVSSESTLAQIIQLVEKALAGRSPIERSVDRLSRLFVPAIVLIALATFLICWTTGAASPGQSLMRAITVLVIACPCALGLATPLVILAALGAASRQGILITDSRVLETLAKVDAVVLDKTGTATEGRFSLLEFRLCAEPGSPSRKEENEAVLAAPPGERSSEALARLAALEACSEHPLGRALLEFAAHESVPLYEASGVAIHKGEGITGRVNAAEVFAGNRRLALRLGASLDPECDGLARAWEQEGKTVVLFGWESRLEGLLSFGDQLRPAAAALTFALHRQGVKVHLVSGDSETTTRAVAAAIHADSCCAECLPQQKIDIIRALQAAGSSVAMIGDGINDAPALAQSNLGIAMGSGTDLAQRAAAVVLMNNSLAKVTDIFALARKSVRIIHQNLFWALFYNSVGITLAVAGVLNPILAAAAMLLSSVSVVVNSLRLATPPRHPA
jgi:heavy metal translocating P-type ATPase